MTGGCLSIWWMSSIGTSGWISRSPPRLWVGIYQYDDGRDTPDNINMVVKYPGKVNVTFEATITDMKSPEVADIVFMGTGGRLSIFREGYTFIAADDDQITVRVPYASARDHLQNWLDCVRSRKRA